MSQDAALEAQLRGQQNIGQGLAELPGAITTVLNRAQAPTRRMLVDPKGLGEPPMFSGIEEHFNVWTKKIENYVSGVFPNVRGALAFAAELQDVVTSATVAIGVPELGVETSAEIDVQLFVVLSALTEGESFDIVMSVGGDHGFESWRKLHGRWNPYTAGRARSLLREILCAIEKMEDLVRRYSSRRDAQGNAHNLAEDVRMSPLEALLPDDLAKHVQLNRSRLTSYGVLREEIKTTVTVGATQLLETRSRKARHTQEEMTRWTLVRLAKAKANKAKASTARAEAKGTKDSKDSTDRTRTTTPTKEEGKAAPPA